MTPGTKALLESLPLPRDEFVRRHGEVTLRNMCVVGGIREAGGQVVITPFGATRLMLAQLPREK